MLVCVCVCVCVCLCFRFANLPDVASIHIPYYIMTSDGTHDQTVTFWQSHDYFGLSAADVFFFQQGKIISKAVFSLHVALFLSSADVYLTTDGDGDVCLCVFCVCVCVCLCVCLCVCFLPNGMSLR